MQKQEKDELWDIESLLPKRKRRPVRFDVSATELSIGNSGGSADLDDDRRISFFGRGEPEMKLIFEYSPENAFVKSVGIYKRVGGAKYYEDFEQTMHKYLRLTVKSAERVPFFSYFPQYSQLDRAQMEWYLFWRSGCRRREYMQTDFSYILLYVFELINFENPKYPDRIAEELCALWENYRAEHVQLDKYLPSWLLDYCFIHKIPLAVDRISGFLSAVFRFSYLREAYLGSADCVCDAIDSAIVSGISGYDYKKSKYYTDENKQLFDAHIYGAAAAGLGLGIKSMRDASVGAPTSTMRREAYVGALCTSTAARSIEIEYQPIYRTGMLRAEATLAVKYAENRLRGILGVRSRLSVNDLSDKVRAGVDEYFSEHFSDVLKKQKKEQPESAPSYMAYYESESTGLEICRAADIERASWSTAQLMGECFEDDENEAEVNFEMPAEESRDNNQARMSEPAFSSFEVSFSLSDNVAEPEEGVKALVMALSERERTVLSLLLSDPSAAERYAVSEGTFLADVCDAINERALELIGDILVECVGDGYSVLCDYESEVRKCQII